VNVPQYRKFCFPEPLLLLRVAAPVAILTMQREQHKNIENLLLRQSIFFLWKDTNSKKSGMMEYEKNHKIITNHIICFCFGFWRVIHLLRS
jgi:hypothetical protein